MAAAPDAGFPIPAGEHAAERIVSRSRFRATLGHAPDRDAALALVARIRAADPDATHHCWAFVAGPPGSSAHVGCSDDGEPHGTAGRPILTVLEHGGVGEIVAVVTRWYGGTKLGTGGLARAYGGAAQDALAGLPLTRRVDWAPVHVAFDYAEHDAVRALLGELGGEVDDVAYGVAVTLRGRVPVPVRATWRARLDDVTRGRARDLDEAASG